MRLYLSARGAFALWLVAGLFLAWCIVTSGPFH
jgi:hypothetical protein